MTQLPPVASVFPSTGRCPIRRSCAADVEALAADLAGRLSADGAFAFRSGRAGLAALLRVIAEDRVGRGVIVPAYTCYTVAAAVARAGLTIFPSDVNPETLDYDEKRRGNPAPGDAIAVVSSGLFGLPGDMAAIETLCREQHLFFIDDAAQTFGAEFDGRPLGSFGDASLLSFGRGKPVGLIGGGVVLTRGRALTERMRAEEAVPHAMARWNLAARYWTSTLAVRPAVFTWIRLLPWVTIGQSVFDPNFETTGLDSGRARVIRHHLAELDDLVAGRRQVTAALRRRLDGLSALTVPRPHDAARPSYLRFPVIFHDAADRDAALYRLARKGLGASIMYPQPIHRVEEARPFVNEALGPFPGAERIARGIVTLPTHDFVNDRHLDDIAAVIRDAVSAGVDAR
jgi:dTDP-4-amino-4,6-dideoxygalactose transaminase